MYSNIVAALAGVVALHAGHVAAQTKISFDTNTKYQTMDGFGFSEAFGFGGGVQNAASAQQTKALDLLFSTTSGAGMTILRNRIGADSGSTIEPNSPGAPGNTPTYRALNGDSSQVFWSQKARAMGVKYIYADAWSAPGFMKTTGSYEGGGYLCGVTGHSCSSGDWRQAYANYLVQYLKDYKALGITVDFVGFLNEPEYAASYDAMLSDGTEAASFIPILKKTIEAAGLSTGITCCDAEGWTDQVKYTQQLQAAGVESDLARITSHWYLSKADGPMDTTLRVWETEYADLDDAFSTTWHSSGAFNEGFTWAQLIYQGVVTSNLSAFLYWVGAQSNSNAAALVSLNGNNVIASGSLWAFAMYSRFIRPDAVRIGTSGAPSNTKIGAFQNTDGSIAVIMINTGSGSQSVSIGGVSGSATAYYMDNSVSSPSTLSVNVSGGSAGLTLPGYSMVTVVIKGGSSTGGGNPPPQSTSSSAPAHSTTSSSGGGGGGVAGHWDQCGGIGYSGPTTCASGYTCTVVNPYYSQCI